MARANAYKRSNKGVSMQAGGRESVQIEKNCEFVSKQDGLRIKYDVYQPLDSQNTDTHSRILIQIAHGMVEHKERYEWVGVSLAQRGFYVVINDHRGHGESVDELHPLGEMNGIESAKIAGALEGGFRRAVEDMHQLTLIAKERFHPAKCVLLGHSMGSLLSRGYLILHAKELDGLILSGSPAYNPLVGFGQVLAQILSFVGAKEWGKHFVNSLSFGGFNKPFAHNEGEDNAKGGCAWLCRDKAVVEAYKADFKCSFVFSLESFAWLFEGMKWVNATIPVGAEGLPLLVISGDCDSCGEFGRGVKRIAQQYEKWGLKVQLKLYEGARHEILNETNKQEVLEDIVRFVK